MSSQEEKDKSYLLALLLFIGAGFLIFSYLGQGKTPKGSSLSVNQKKLIEENVNKHLMHTNDAISLQQQRMAVENAKLLYETQQNRKPRREAYSNDHSFDLSYETRAHDVARDLGRDQQNKLADSYSPHDIVQKEMYDQIENQKQEQAYREEYARQFVENARRGGYDIQLTDDLSRVKSVKEIRKSNGQMELFGSRGDALR